MWCSPFLPFSLGEGSICRASPAWCGTGSPLFSRRRTRAPSTRWRQGWGTLRVQMCSSIAAHLHPLQPRGAEGLRLSTVLGDPSEREQPGSRLSERSPQALTAGMWSRSLLMPIRRLLGPSLLKLAHRRDGESPGDKKRILILGVLPTLPQLQSF